MIIKMLNEHGRRVDEYNEKFNKELKNIKKSQTVKNIIIEMKSTIEESTVD